MSSLPKYEFVQNDTAPDLQETLEYSDGTPVDLTGCSVKFHMQAVSSSTPKVNANATVVSATDGTVKYVWAATDLDTSGLYNCEWQVTFANGKIQSSDPSFQILVRPEYG